MRDHAVGSYGAVAIALALALKIAAIAAAIADGRALFVLALAPVMGRWAAVLLGATHSYVREDDGTGSPTRWMGRTELAVATVTAAAAAVACGWRGEISGLLIATATGFLGLRARSRIGGVTGDVLGAGVVAAECLTLLVFAFSV